MVMFTSSTGNDVSTLNTGGFGGVANPKPVKTPVLGVDVLNVEVVVGVVVVGVVVGCVVVDAGHWIELVDWSDAVDWSDVVGWSGTVCVVGVVGVVGWSDVVVFAGNDVSMLRIGFGGMYNPMPVYKPCLVGMAVLVVEVDAVDWSETIDWSGVVGVIDWSGIVCVVGVVG